MNLTASLSFGWDALQSYSLWGSFARQRFPLSPYKNQNIYLRSSVWHDLKRALPILNNNNRWIISNGGSVSFWFDKWLDEPIISPTLFSVFSPKVLPRVSDVIEAQSWSLPDYFSNLFPSIVQQILRLPLPLNAKDDKLIWEPSPTGKFSFSSGYHLIRRRHSDCDWVTVIWQHFIPPRQSILAWRLFHDKLPTEDALQRRGIFLASICLCRNSEESIAHLFFGCRISRQLWRWLTC